MPFAHAFVLLSPTNQSEADDWPGWNNNKPVLSLSSSMPGEKDLQKLLKTISPRLNPGEYVFCTAADPGAVPAGLLISFFKEDEAYTLIMAKETADQFALNYTFIAAWITLTVHSSLEAVGLTAAFSKTLAEQGISCNVVAAFHHDHIFVKKADAQKALQALQKLATQNPQTK